jgi:ankyrin repeat protein
MALQADCVRLLLRHGAELNAIDQSGGTPLMHAAWFGCVTSVEILLHAGANAQMTDHRGRSAQQLAQERGHAAIAKLLGKNS